MGNILKKIERNKTKRSSQGSCLPSDILTQSRRLPVQTTSNLHVNKSVAQTRTISLTHDKSSLLIKGSVVQESIEVANFITICDYDKYDKDDIGLKKNDKLLVLNQNHPDWWLAKNLRTNEIGYVPNTFIAPIDSVQIEAYKDWYFPNCARREAERLLEYLDNQPGTFLIRESEQEKNIGWSLSILDYNNQNERHTKHYRIRKLDNGGCYIWSNNGHLRKFTSLDELVAYYSKSSNGLCRALTQPCPKQCNFVGFKDVWEEDRENIEIGPILGSGNFGDVYRGIWRGKYPVAVKMLKLSKENVDEQLKCKQFLAESNTMKKLRHERLVKLWCVCTCEEPILIVTELMVNGNLLTYLREGEGKNLRFKDIIDMAAQIASGMKFLEICKYVHRDIAARNILVGERNVVKIADFGFAQMLNANNEVELTTEECNKFPVKWTAPEVFTPDPITQRRKYTIKSDVWSFGVLLFELITLGQTPYLFMTHIEVVNKVKNLNYRMPNPKGLCTDEYYSMMLKCWHEDPLKRPTFEALFHYFNDFYINTEPSYKEPSY